MYEYWSVAFYDWCETLNEMDMLYVTATWIFPGNLMEYFMFQYIKQVNKLPDISVLEVIDYLIMWWYLKFVIFEEPKT